MESKADHMFYTVTDAAAAGNRARELRLSHRHLVEAPKGLNQLRGLCTLDLQDNPIRSISCTALPATLQELTLTGCKLQNIPRSLASLTNLKHLFLSANQIQNLEGLWSCPSIMHVGLSYNKISSLCSSSSSSHSCPVMSLDLAHNDICDLDSSLATLGQLSQLKSLSLKGNPLSLRGDYRARLLGQLVDLAYLDDQKLGFGPSSPSRPQSSSSDPQLQQGGPSAASFFVPCKSPAADPAVGGTTVGLELSCLALAEPPEAVFAALQGGWAAEEQVAAAAAAAKLTLDAVKAAEGGDSPQQEESRAAATAPITVATAPLRPLLYHMELTDVDGVSYCSTPLLVTLPPADGAAAAAAALTATAAPPLKGKGTAKGGAVLGAAAVGLKGDAAAGKVKSGTKAVKGGLLSVPEVASSSGTAAQVLAPGYCKIQLQLRADVKGRDWLRRGATVELIRTHWRPQAPTLLTASPSESGAGAAGPKAGAASGAKAGKPAAGSNADVPAIQWSYSMEQNHLGTATMNSAQLIECSKPPVKASGVLSFKSKLELLDEGCIRLPLERAMDMQRVVASCTMDMVLQFNDS